MTPIRLGHRKFVLAITGRRAVSPRYTEELAQAAILAGKIATEFGLVVLTGGLSGVMERAAEGAKTAGGETIGILPSDRHDDANPFIDLALPSGIGIARNYLIATACDAMLALPGGTGTLEEICFALDFGRPVISWGSWNMEGVHKVDFPNENQLRDTLQKIVAEKLSAR